MGRRRRTKNHFDRALRLLGHRFQIAVILLNLFLALLLSGYKALRPDTHSGAKDVAQKCDYEEETNYFPHRVRVEICCKVTKSFRKKILFPPPFIIYKRFWSLTNPNYFPNLA